MWRKWDWNYVLKLFAEAILGIAVVVGILVFLLSTRESETTVMQCIAEGNYYVVYVVDEKGNEYAYYDGDYIHTGTKIMCVFHGDEIVEAYR